MAVVCPTILAQEPHEFREQMERVGPFAQRIQVDISDGKFTQVKTVLPEQLWWPRNLGVDIHVMYQNPESVLDELIHLQPNLIILHAESHGNFKEMARKLRQHKIRVGVALLPTTPPEAIEPAIDLIDHVLLFSGDLGHFGGTADLSLLEKIPHLRSMKKNLEIGWDGGINDTHAPKLVEGGVNVLNSGGFIQKSDDPAVAYKKLLDAVKGAK